MRHFLESYFIFTKTAYDLYMALGPQELDGFWKSAMQDDNTTGTFIYAYHFGHYDYQPANVVIGLLNQAVNQHHIDHVFDHPSSLYYKGQSYLVGFDLELASCTGSQLSDWSDFGVPDGDLNSIYWKDKNCKRRPYDRDNVLALCRQLTNTIDCKEKLLAKVIMPDDLRDLKVSGDLIIINQ
jgi:hypothetical protein